jgi:uncharacterized protein YbjT (DUF2867 family)
MKVIVIGGTGLIGSKLVTRLAERGHDAVPASPRLGINAVTGDGLAPALEGASVVVDVSNSPSFERAATREFFETSTRNLLAAEAAAGVGHHVALSVVGTDRIAGGGDPATTIAGYFQAKLAQESLILASPIPHTIVRATQFFEFIESIAQSATEGTTVRLPPYAFRPMAADDVTKAVAGATAGEPANGIVEVGGPDEFKPLVANSLTRSAVSQAASSYSPNAFGKPAFGYALT